MHFYTPSVRFAFLPFSSGSFIVSSVKIWVGLCPLCAATSVDAVCWVRGIIGNEDEGYGIGRMAAPEVDSATRSRSMNWYAQNEQKTNIVHAKANIER
jgi:hypothetical protein